MYFLIKDNRKANFNNFDAWKYPIFSHFSRFETLNGSQLAKMKTYIPYISLPYNL